MSPPILVLDDAVVFGQLLSVILRSAGHEVVALRDGLSAIEAEARHRPKLAILDIDMPGIDGLEVLARLHARRSPHELRIMMASARGESAYVRRALEAGACLFLRKPFSAAQLIRRAQALLELGDEPFAPAAAEACFLL